jgi:hypothetical protein
VNARAEAGESGGSKGEPLPIEFREFAASVREVFREIKKLIVFIRNGKNTNAALVILTFLLAIAAVTQAVIYGIQVRPLRLSAGAAQSAADTAASALRIDQRAWLSTWITNDPYKEQEPMHLTVHIRNSGHTFAKNSTINRNVAIVSKGTEPKPDDWRNDDTVTAGLIPPGIGETWTHEIHSSEKLTKTLSDALRDGTKIIYVKGRIDFDDIFPDSHRHWVSFCFRGSNGTTWVTCDTGNDIDPY